MRFQVRLLPLLLWVGLSRPVVPLSFSIFFSKPGPFLRGDFSRTAPSGSGLGLDDPPLGEGGPLKEVSRDRVLFVEEQREELLLAS